MCQKREIGSPLTENLPGSLEEAAPVSFETFDALRSIPTNQNSFIEEEPKKKAKSSLQTKKKGLPIPPGVSFRYYGQPTANVSKEAGARGHQGVMTVAMLQEPTLPGKLLLGFAFCNAGDPRKNIPPDSFCKVEGRDRAMERLFDDPVVAPYLYEPRRMAEYVAGAVATHEFKRLIQYGVQLPPGFAEKVPHWTKYLPQRMKARKHLKKMRRSSSKEPFEKLNSFINAQEKGKRICIIGLPRNMGRSFVSDILNPDRA